MTPAFQRDGVRIYQGDCRAVLRGMAADSVQCVVTSPPYWGLRDYGNEPSVWGGDAACEHNFQSTKVPNGNGSAVSFRRDRAATAVPRVGRQPGICECGAWSGCYGLEPTPEMFVEHTVEIFREVARVLHPSGTLWLNLGDSYGAGGGDRDYGSSDGGTGRALNASNRSERRGTIKPKDLCMIPWRVFLALQEDGWWLRSIICWAKKSPMPESVTDRPTNSWEPIALLTRNAKYFYDAEAVKEEGTLGPIANSAKLLSRPRSRPRLIHDPLVGRSTRNESQSGPGGANRSLLASLSSRSSSRRPLPRDERRPFQ